MSEISPVVILYIISTIRLEGLYESFSPSAVLLLELERLYDSLGITPLGRSAFPGADPPAGPPKSDSTFTATVF